MKRLNNINGKCFFLGSTEHNLKLITERAKKNIPVCRYSYSPPFKPTFNEEDSKAMIDAVNNVEPDVLFVEVTAPKQENGRQHFQYLKAGHICCIGAVFDFYAGTIKRAPEWMIYSGLEWLYRLLSEPRRMGAYLIGNSLFVIEILKEKFISSKTDKVTIKKESQPKIPFKFFSELIFI